MPLLLDAITLEIQRRPFLLRAVTGMARRQTPIFEFNGTVFVVNEQGVREVFSRPADFLFGFGHGHQMKLGPFLFGMDASKQYFAEKAALSNAALFRDQVHRARELVRKEACQLISRVPVDGKRVDLFSEFIEPVLLRAVAQFYGVCPARAPRSTYLSAPAGEKTFAQWIRKLGAVIGSSTPAPFGLEELGNGLAPEMSRFLVSEIERGAPVDSVIGILQQGGTLTQPEDIARCVGGLMLAGAAILKAAIHSLHELVAHRHELLARRPQGLDDAVREGYRGRPEALLGYAWEALRFRPTFSLLPRYCPRDTVLGAGASYERKIRADQAVIVSPLGAMFDPRHVERPDEFIPTRPLATYYHFGFGLHRCFGERLAVVMIPELFSVLLTHVEPVGAGQIGYEGPAVAQYIVRLKPGEPGGEERKVSDETERPDDPCSVVDPQRAA
jgi:cytochrome P450